MKYRVGQAQFIGERDEQQDVAACSSLLHPRFVRHAGILGVVADGMGGLSNGAAAATIAVRVLIDAYHRKPPEEPIPAALLRALLSANQAVLQFSRESSGDGESAATLVAAVVHGNDLHWVSAGDSRAYLIRGGQCIQLTNDHTRGADLDAQAAAQELSRLEALRAPHREQVTSYIGMSETPKVDRNLMPFALEKVDRVLLCSDGLYRALAEEDIARECRGINLDAACGQLIAAVRRLRAPGQDNSTALLMMPGVPAPRRGVLVALMFAGILTALLVLRYGLLATV